MATALRLSRSVNGRSMPCLWADSTTVGMVVSTISGRATTARFRKKTTPENPADEEHDEERQCNPFPDGEDKLSECEIAEKCGDKRRAEMQGRNYGEQEGKNDVRDGGWFSTRGLSESVVRYISCGFPIRHERLAECGRTSGY